MRESFVHDMQHSVRTVCIGLRAVREWVSADGCPPGESAVVRPSHKGANSHCMDGAGVAVYLWDRPQCPTQKFTLDSNILRACVRGA